MAVGRAGRTAPAGVEHGLHPRVLIREPHRQPKAPGSCWPDRKIPTGGRWLGVWKSWVPSHLCSAASLRMLKLPEERRGPIMVPCALDRGLNLGRVGLL